MTKEGEEHVRMVQAVIDQLSRDTLKGVSFDMSVEEALEKLDAIQRYLRFLPKEMRCKVRVRSGSHLPIVRHSSQYSRRKRKKVEVEVGVAAEAAATYESVPARIQLLLSRNGGWLTAKEIEKAMDKINPGTLSSALWNLKTKGKIKFRKIPGTKKKGAKSFGARYQYGSKE